MKRRILKNFISMAVVIISIASIFTTTSIVKADADSMLWGGYESNVQSATGLGNTDPREMVGSVIKVMLGFLGIIAVIIILYGGFKWMTAAGNEENVSSAKKIITAGIIGLIIVLMAFGIAQFIIEGLHNATGATG